MKSVFTSLLVTALWAGTAWSATITPASGVNLSRNATQADDTIQVYAEATEVIVGAGEVFVDYLVGQNLNVGDAFYGVNTASGGPFLTAGTYNSYLIHFDPFVAGSASDTVNLNETIVGIIVSNQTAGGTGFLNSSNGTFGTAAAYDGHRGRRSETHDNLILLDATTLFVELSTSDYHIDNIRVLTVPSPIPLPASLWLLLTALGGLLWCRRKRATRTITSLP